VNGIRKIPTVIDQPPRPLQKDLRTILGVAADPPQLRRVSHRANNIAEVAFLPPDRGDFKLVSHRLTTTLIV
jgi:hypothetical protein